MRLSDEQHAFLDTQGFLMVPDALQGELLAEVRETFYRVEEETRPAWKESLRRPPAFKPYGLGPTAHVVEPIVTHADIFLDLLEYPLTVATLQAFLGPDIQMLDNALHVKPAGTRTHTRWHRDAAVGVYSGHGWSAEESRAWERTKACERPCAKLKVFFFVDDIDAETGPFSVVPGTHKLEVDRVPQYDPLTDMPGHVQMVGKAGTALIWHATIWHTAMDNTGARNRRMILYNYAHYGMKQYEPCVPTAELAARARRRSPLCRQLLGLERMSET